MAEVTSASAGIILQARTGSTRLPNKVLRPLASIPILTHCIRRLKPVAKVIVATSDLQRDDEVQEIARKENVSCFRGSESDVLDRYYQAAKEFQLKYIIRATADNPLVDPHEASRVLDHLVSNRLDYVNGANKIDGYGLPTGVGVEAFLFQALERSWKEGGKGHHREHVNEYILENQEGFNIQWLKCLKENSCPELSLTVDTHDDFVFVNNIISSFKCDPTDIKITDIIQWWQRR